jgi:porin
VRVRVEPVPQVYAMLGLFNGDPTLGANDKHGADWSMRGPLFAIAEIGYRINQAPERPGLPGNYKIGAYYNGGTFTDFLRDSSGGLAPVTGLPPQTTHGNTGFYVLADQMVYREGGGKSKQGLTSFVAVLVAPDASINQMPLFVNGGLVYRGAIPRRDHDIAGFGVIYGRFSRDLRRSQQLERQAGIAAPVQDFEVALEWTYIVQAARWLAVQPDVQYIIKPGGTGTIPNALVVGFQLSVTF